MVYLYRCPRCLREFTRVQILLSERDQQFHTAAQCHVDLTLPSVRLEYIFNGTRNRSVVYANDWNTKGDIPCGGPRSRAKYLKDHGLIEVGNESPDKVTQLATDGARDTHRKQIRELHDAIMEEARDYSEEELVSSTPLLDDCGEHDPDYAKRRYKELTGREPTQETLIGAEAEVTPEDVEEVEAIVND